jgi:hypothetical protein
MKPLLIIALAVPLLAQQSPAPAQSAAPAAATPAAAAAAEPAPAASPKPSTEEWFTGYVEAGYQGLTGVGGSFDTYRSVVNLGSGLKLLDTDFTILDPKHRLFERLRVRADHWGDDPFSSLHVFVEKRGIYKILADVRRLSYFNDLPSYADPTRASGAALDQQSFDMRRHLGTYDLELFNNHIFSPYLEYQHDGSSGQGVTVFETSADQFAVPYTSTESTELYRAGTHITGSRFHITLEAGGTTFKNSQNTYTATSQAPNPGDNTVPIFGYTQGLSSLLDAYGIRGSSVFSRAVFTATPFRWLDFYGHFEYSEPKSTLNYQQYNSGAFVLESQVLLYNSEQYLIGSAASQPHTSGNVGVEVRPLRHIRLLESWSTDRLHDSGSATQNDNLISGASASTLIATALASVLATNYSQADTTVIADATSTITLRGGYRYVWGNASDMVLPTTQGLPGVIAENLRRNVFTGAVTWRPSEKVSFTGETEVGSSTGAYFLTSLYNYTKARGMGRYQLLKTLHASIDYTVLKNNNPNAGSAYFLFSHQETASLDWTPKGDKFTFDGSYSHCSFHSEIDYLTPSTLTPTLSDYRENCHNISGYLNAKLKGFTKGQIIQLAAGGAAVLTSGSRPTNYYQPTARLVIPMTKRVGLFGEWRYYGLGEAYYGYESFRAHLLTVGLRYTR